jgi:drug/metabolite transporter (DMT)-like permease
MLSGVLLALAAAACFECSYVLQALEVRSLPAIGRPGVGPLRRLVAKPRWTAAIALGLAGFGLQVLALRHAPVALVQPLLAAGLLALLGFSVVVLREPVGRRELAAVVAIVVGIALIALADPARGTRTDPTAFAVAAAVLGAIALAGFVRRAPGDRVLLGAAIAADALAVLAAAQAARVLPALLPAAAWCALAGGGGLAALAAESVALQRRGAARVAPIVVGGQVTLPVVLAPLVFGERWSATAGGSGLVVGGLVAVVIGSALLAASPAAGRLTIGDTEHELGSGGQLGDLRP